MESVDIGGIKGVDDRKQSQNDKLADVTDELFLPQNKIWMMISILARKEKLKEMKFVKEEATDGSAKENVKSYKKSDVKNIKGDVQDGNAKG
ncbi:hypothetical protein LguiA_007057 [Lonicera macranthoides]